MDSYHTIRRDTCADGLPGGADTESRSGLADACTYCAYLRANPCPYCGALLGPLPDPVQLQPAAGRVPDGALGAGVGDRGDGTGRDGLR